MNERTRYQQLQPEDRMTMASMRQQGSSMRAMARMLGRSASTISRELGRNTLAELPYASHSAQVSSPGRRQGPRPTRKLDMQGVGWGSPIEVVVDFLMPRNAEIVKNVPP